MGARIVEHRWWITVEVDRSTGPTADGVFTWTDRYRFWKLRGRSRAQARAVDRAMEERC
jgi:hypothetical protein